MWSTDAGILLGILILITCGVIILRYLCSFGYGVFCYNGPAPPEDTVNPSTINSPTIDIVNSSKNQIIQVTVTDDDYYVADIEISEQRNLPVARMV